MVLIQFIDNKTVLLSQLRENIPSVNEDIKIKGRKAKVLSVTPVDKNQFHVHVMFEPVIKSKTIAKDINKKKR